TGIFSFHITTNSRNSSVSIYWSGGGSSNISDRETEVISGLIKTVGALKNISYSSCFPSLTSSIICINSSALSSVAISSMKCENNLIFDGSFSIKYPNESRSKLTEYLIAISNTSYLLYLGKAVAIVPSLSKYIYISKPAEDEPRYFPSPIYFLFS